MNKVRLTGKIKNMESKFLHDRLLVVVRFTMNVEGDFFECLATGKLAEKMIREDEQMKEDIISLYGRLQNYRYKDVNHTIHKNKYIVVYNLHKGDKVAEISGEEERKINQRVQEYLEAGQAPFSMIADAYT